MTAGKDLKAVRGTPVGQPAPSSVIERWHNANFRQFDLQRKVVLVHFWGVWCGPYKRQMPQIHRLTRKHGGKGPVTAGVHTRVAKENLPEFLTMNDLPYLVAVNHGGKDR